LLHAISRLHNLIFVDGRSPVTEPRRLATRNEKDTEKSHAFGNSSGKHAFHALLGKEKKTIGIGEDRQYSSPARKTHWLNEKIHLDSSK
jgi:hypothetical protein